MALLTPVHWEVISVQMQDVLKYIGSCAWIKRFYLAGGTALALRLGHRLSIDLDFFSEVDEINQSTRQEIKQTLSELHPQMLEDVDGNLLLRVDQLRIGFFGYGYPLLALPDTVTNVPLAALVDIGLMKLDALISRGSRKDFYDLYMVAQHISLPALLAQGSTKYPYARDFALMAVESLVLFENADRDLQPELLIDLPWPQVKFFFVAQSQALGKTWFDDQVEIE